MNLVTNFVILMIMRTVAFIAAIFLKGISYRLVLVTIEMKMA